MKHCIMLPISALALVLVLSACGNNYSIDDASPPPATSAVVLETIEPSIPSGNDTPPVMFESGEHHYTTKEFNRNFKTTTATDGLLTITIELSIFEEHSASELWYKVYDDIVIVTKALNIEQRPVTIFIVKTLINGIQRVDDRLYCLAEDVTSDNYRTMLVNTLVNSNAFPNEWSAIGLTRYAYAETADDEDIAAYYKTSENIDVLSLFPAFFIDAFATEREVQIARDTSLSLTKFVIEHYGTEVCLESGFAEYKQKWLNSLGVDRVYTEPPDEIFDCYTYSRNDKYPLIATTDKGDVFYLQSLLDLKTPSDFILFLHEAKKGVQAIINAINENAPDSLSHILDNFSSPIHYYCEYDENSYASMADPIARTVKLVAGESLVHETVHIIIPTTAADRWKHEAIADYLSITFFPSSAYAKKIIDFINDNESDETEFDKDEAEFNRLIKDFYKELPLADDDDSSIVSHFRKARARTELLYEVDSVPWVQSISQIHKTATASETRVIRKSNGGELTYYQAFCFMDYLVNKYSFATIMDYCILDVAFDETFGVSYEQAKAEWLKVYF